MRDSKDPETSAVYHVTEPELAGNIRPHLSRPNTLVSLILIIGYTWKVHEKTNRVSSVVTNTWS
jgi:hypothetical protein